VVGEALPLLAFILRELAEGLPAGGTLSLSHYHGLGGVQGALARHADAALTKAVQVSGLTEREVLAGLTRLVTVDETGPDTAPVTIEGFSGRGRPGCEQLIDRYRIACRPVRDVLFDYLRERQTARDFSSLQHLAYLLGKLFWGRTLNRGP
jgi:hypothetical protein